MTEIAGLALGIVTLLDTCVTTCDLISKAKHFPDDLEVQRVGFLWEESRLKDWAKKWELDSVGPTRPADLQSAKLLVDEATAQAVDLDLIKDTLKNTEKLLERCQEMLGRHALPSGQEPAVFRKVLKQVSRGKSRIQWSVIDSTTLRTLVADFEKQNDRLNRMQPRLNSTSREVQRLMAASRTMTSLDQLGITPDYQALDGYPEIKRLFLMRSEQNRTEATSPEWTRSGGLEVKQAEYNVAYNSNVSSLLREAGTFGSTRDDVLIEWKYYVASDPDSKEMALSRTERIAELLAVKGKPRGFRILDCVGWFVNGSKNRCGIMFSIPQHVRLKARGEVGTIHCFSLSDLILAKTRPTLRERFRLAYLLTMSLVELHLAKWLHKNFSSDNIIFFAVGASKDSTATNELGVDFVAPYVASFGLARPDCPNELSSIAMGSAPVNAAYQHPEYSARTVAGESSTFRMPRYHRTYDIYSLGCVLLEISMWTSLRDLGWGTQAFTNNPAAWKQRLVDITNKNVAFHSGPIYRDIVLSCLESKAPSDSQVAAGSAGSDSAETFGWNILRKLDQLSV